MKGFLEELLPRVLPAERDVVLVAHEGKADLEGSLPRKLRGWRSPNARFVVVRDQDSADCLVVKRRLAKIASDAGRPDTIVRIACRELEAWLLGDIPTVSKIFGVPSIAGLELKAKYRQPDSLGSPSRELKILVPGYQKISGARSIGRHINLDTCGSHSFGVFVHTLKGL